jgi:hypothetical protein
MQSGHLGDTGKFATDEQVQCCDRAFEARQQRVPWRLEHRHAREALGERLACAHQRPPAHQQARERIHGRHRGLPGAKLRALMHQVAHDHACITTVGLATLPDRLGVVLEHLGVKHDHQPCRVCSCASTR